MDGGAWKAAVHGVAEGWIRLSDFTFTFHFHALEKEMAAHSSVLAWRIPGTGEEPDELPSMGSQRVGHDWSDLAAAVEYILKLMNTQCRGGSSFAKQTRALKMRSAVAGHWKLTTKIENHHQSWSSYNYMRSCQRTQRQPFYSYSSFEANWKGEKAW